MVQRNLKKEGAKGIEDPKEAGGKKRKQVKGKKEGREEKRRAGKKNMSKDYALGH